MSLALTTSRDGVLFGLRVRPGAPRERVLGVHGDRLKVAVRPAPERGRANDAVLALLSRLLDLPRHALELRSGAASPDKTVLVRDIGPADLAARLDALVRSAGGKP